MTEQNLDLYFMQEALKQAHKAYSLDEVPVGAVLVHQKKIIARGYNQVEMLKDPTAHAEMICLTAGANYFNNWRLTDSVLYCTLEPCCMCIGAIIAARVKKVVWAAADLRVGANGSWIDILQLNHPIHKVEAEQGLLQEESQKLLKMFFQKKRQWKSMLEDLISS